MWRRRLALASLVPVVWAVGLVGVAAPHAQAASGLSWSSRLLVDPPDGGIGHELGASSCPSNKLCAVVDQAGNVILSTNPTAGVSAWKLQNIDSNRLNGISCHPTLCVAVDGEGFVVVSTNPTAKTPTWSSPALIDPNAELGAISCPSTKLCVAVDNVGNVVTSTDPAGGASKWNAASVDAGNVLEAISCPTTTFCVGLDRKGNSVSSNNPAGGLTKWTLHLGVDPSTSLFSENALSCPSKSFCAAVNETGPGGNFLTTTSPATGAKWKIQFVDGHFHTPFGMSCPSTVLCVAVDDNGFVFTSTNPTGGKKAWSKVFVDGRWSLLDVSCTSTPVCVSGDQGGNIVVGLPVPDTKITRSTISKSKHTATFSFKGSGIVSGFQCALSKGTAKPSYSPCTSPKTYKNLAGGSYTFRVRALNLASRDPTPARMKFTI